MNKPDVLSDEELDKAYCLADLHTDIFGHKAIAQAQRDADVKWYEGSIEEHIIEETLQKAYMNGWRKGNELKQKRLGIKLKQAKEEVAREIIEDIGFIAQSEKLTQYLKDKYLKG